jgi:hypothetical protein
MSKAWSNGKKEDVNKAIKKIFRENGNKPLTCRELSKILDGIFKKYNVSPRRLSSYLKSQRDWLDFYRNNSGRGFYRLKEGEDA